VPDPSEEESRQRVEVSNAPIRYLPQENLNATRVDYRIARILH